MPVLRGNPADRMIQLLESLHARVSGLERVVGKRASLTAPSGATAKLAVFADGKVGLRVYDSTGALVHDLTA